MSFWKSFVQSGGGNGGSCSLCGSPGVTKATCPCNPKAKNPNSAKHPLAKKICLKIKKQARPKAKKSIHTQKGKVALKADFLAAQPLEIIQEVLLQIDNESTISIDDGKPVFIPKIDHPRRDIVTMLECGGITLQTIQLAGPNTFWMCEV